jgi:hypothetical protein
MNENTQGPRWAAGDMHTVTVSMPDNYALSTARPVRYAEVRNGDVVLGYLWVAVGEEAAGYEPRVAAGDDGENTGVRCYARLRKAKAAGVATADLLSWFRSGDGPTVSTPEHEAENLARLRELAAAS